MGTRRAVPFSHVGFALVFQRGGGEVSDRDPGHEEEKYRLKLRYCNDLYTLLSPSARRVVLMILRR